MIKQCEICGKKFEANKGAKTCSNNCRQKLYYRKKKNGIIREYKYGRTEEEKKEIINEYHRNYYHNNIKYKEIQKQRSNKRYKQLIENNKILEGNK